MVADRLSDNSLLTECCQAIGCGTLFIQSGQVMCCLLLSMCANFCSFLELERLTAVGVGALPRMFKCVHCIDVWKVEFRTDVMWHLVFASLGCWLAAEGRQMLIDIAKDQYMLRYNFAA